MTENTALFMDMLYRMQRIRIFEEQVIKMVEAGEIQGAVHSYIGQEAVAVGTCVALRDDDYITGNHRSHGHPLAKGGTMKGALAELLGKKTGYCKGKGGSMHLADFSIGILGESGIVASSMPVTVGAALGSKMQGTDRVAVCFFGDGASNQGAFHEAINLAAIWKLPAILVCENNGYAITTAYSDSVATANISDRAIAYDIPGVLVDGQDVIAVYEVVSQAVQRARSAEGPSLIEARTYRYEDHTIGLARIVKEPYRTEEEIQEWRDRDPILIQRERIISQGLASQEEVDNQEAKVRQELEEAVKFAYESPYPDPSELFEDMYADAIALD